MQRPRARQKNKNATEKKQGTWIAEDQSTMTDAALISVVASLAQPLTPDTFRRSSRILLFLRLLLFEVATALFRALRQLHGRVLHCPDFRSGHARGGGGGASRKGQRDHSDAREQSNTNKRRHGSYLSMRPPCAVTGSAGVPLDAVLADFVVGIS